MLTIRTLLPFQKQQSKGTFTPIVLMPEIPVPPPQLQQLVNPTSSWEQLMFTWFHEQSGLVKGIAFFQVDTGSPAQSRGRKGVAVIRSMSKLAAFGEPGMDLDEAQVERLLTVFNRPDNKEIYLFNSKFLVAVGDRKKGLYLQKSVMASVETDPQEVTCLKIMLRRKPQLDLYRSNEYDEAARRLFILFTWAGEDQGRVCNRKTSHLADWINTIMNENV
ncbi:hypothetical protein Ciccas_009805 [Cichlidogyrus casuarinus]|uniref:Uncharacterized protein n=1 Tax=Cichlidogyrus casuarinus TaxID=1844966 RepID=A0ABD2PVY4_9PLAT